MEASPPESVNTSPEFSESVRSKSPPPVFSESVRPKSSPPLFSESVRSKSPPPLFSESVRSKSPPPLFSESVRSKSPPPLFSESVRSMSPPPLFSESVRSKSPPPLFSKSVRSKSPPPEFSESVRSKSPPPLFSESVRSKSPPPLFSESVRSKSPPPLFSESVRSKSPPPEFSESVRSKSPPPEFSDEPAAANRKVPHGFVSPRSKSPTLKVSLQPASKIWSRDSDTCQSDFSTALRSENVDAGRGVQHRHFLTTQGEHGRGLYRESLKTRCDHVTEGFEGAGERTSLSRIYTELYITQAYRKEQKTQHELQKLEAGFQKVQEETPIRCQDIFTAQHHDPGPIRAVMTKGVAGVGKTFAVLKFCVDWARGLENQDLDLVLPLSFRELNLTRGRRYSMLELIYMFHPSLRSLSAHSLLFGKVLFIFDGLDESRLLLDFKCELLSDVCLRAEVSVLLVNLIRASLLPDALVWITSRPAAVAQVPGSYVHRLTEVRGFREAQKQQYFTKSFSDEQQRHTVLSHIRASRSLNSMCQIPVFCWITATVLDHMLRSTQSGPLPQTLTDMYAHFLLVQTKRKGKYRAESSRTLQVTPNDCEVLLKLGRLAFDHLSNGNLMFYQKDMQLVGLDLTEASVYSGLCTEILKKENILFQEPVYSFIHLSVQEFLSAVYMFHCFNHNKVEQIKNLLGYWEDNMPLHVFLKKSVEKSFENESGRLDLFVRFLHGLLQESNQRLLRDLVGPVQTDSQSIQKTIQNLRDMNTGNISAHASITVFCCLREMKDHSVHLQILNLLKTELESDPFEFHCTTLANKLQMPQEVLEELNIKRFTRLPDGRLELVIPDTCREATILWNGLLKEHAAVVAEALKASSSQLRHLDLWLRDGDAVEAFCEGLRDKHCRLESLSLHHSRLSESSCSCLASALDSNPSYLRTLDLSWNEDLQDPGVRNICSYLQSSHCCLESLRLESCGLGKGSCWSLCSALMLNPHHLRSLNLTENQLGDDGVEGLCEVLRMPQLRLELLILDNCGLSADSFSSLASALSLNPESNLKKLDLSVNAVKDCGVERLCGYLQSPQCHLEAMELKGCGLTDHSCALLSSALNANMKDLRLNWNPELKDTGAWHMSVFLQSERCGLEVLRLRGCDLTGKSCWSLASALKSKPLSPVRELDLCENSLTQGDVEDLTLLLHHQHHRLEKLEWEEN